MKLLFILLLLSVQGYAQQIITESYVTVEIRNPHALTAPQVPMMVPNTPVIDGVPYANASTMHYQDSLMVNGQVSFSWWLHKEFNRWKSEDDPEYRKFIIDLCKNKHWISKDYYERTISGETPY